jgi:uncharacterized protein with HEPN domain
MSERSDRLYCQDILESGAAIRSYVEEIDFETFVRDRMRYSAVIREFEIIGEAVGKLSAEVKQSYPDISWQDIKDFRNLLAHEYSVCIVVLPKKPSGQIKRFRFLSNFHSLSKKIFLPPLYSPL